MVYECPSTQYPITQTVYQQQDAINGMKMKKMMRKNGFFSYSHESYSSVESYIIFKCEFIFIVFVSVILNHHHHHPTHKIVTHTPKSQRQIYLYSTRYYSIIKKRTERLYTFRMHFSPPPFLSPAEPH